MTFDNYESVNGALSQDEYREFSNLFDTYKKSPLYFEDEHVDKFINYLIRIIEAKNIEIKELNEELFQQA